MEKLQHLCVDTHSGDGHFHGYVYHQKSKNALFQIAVKASAYMHAVVSVIYSYRI